MLRLAGYLAFAALLASSLALGLLVRHLRKLEAARKHLKDTQAWLDESMRLGVLEELAASIAHEIAQPLSAIVLDGQACLRWMRQDNPPKHEMRDCVERMTSDGRRAAETMAQVRQRVRRPPPQLIPTSINDVVRAIAPLIAHEMARHGATLELRLSPGLPQTLADAGKLQQVFMNLTHNALQAMSGMKERPARIVIASRTDEAGALAVSVADNGPGIASEDLAQIFEPFHTTRDGALGLGLAICRSVVEAHGGEIHAINHPDCGATFLITLLPA
ncbi:sensor histidine kinase [Paraburkholderia pallida]|uniref:histidine kinase n=1 Tax=Paraburkholderia pallida TaxID=2547399 RepID=A0A4P7D5L9_9BURK|nr:ATP-binding protein [Paraburkholderia pallida]QBR02095.1 ATP-binding protein [Paraburkholderia pallida]